MMDHSARQSHRVLYLSLFGDLSRGGQNSIMLLLNGLDRERVQPALVLPEAGNMADRAKELDIPVYVVPWTRFKTLNPFQVSRSYRELAKVIHAFQPDILHTDSPRNSHLAALLKKRAKLLVHLRVSTPDGLSDRLLAAEADAMIAVSQGAALRFKGYPGYVKRKMRVVPNAVQVERFSPVDAESRKAIRTELGLPQDVPVVAFLASYDPVKRHDFFLSLWPEVVKKVPDAQLALAGKGLDDAMRKWGDYLRDGDALNSVHALDFISQPEKFLAACDLLVLPSSEEGFPRAAIEAAACGLPCVVSDLPGVREGIIDGETGVAVAAHDPRKWVEVLGEMLPDRERCREMGIKAIEHVTREFSAQQHAERIMAIYDELHSVG